MSRKAQVRRSTLTVAAALVAVHMAAWFVWAELPLFRQCTQYVVTTRLQGSVLELTAEGQTVFGDSVGFWNYPYTDVSTVVLSHIYGIALCVVLVMVLYIAVFLSAYFRQERGSRMSLTPLWGMSCIVITFASFFVSLAALQFNLQFQTICGTGI